MKNLGFFTNQETPRQNCKHTKRTEDTCFPEVKKVICKKCGFYFFKVILFLLIFSCDMSIIDNFWYIDTTKVDVILISPDQIDGYMDNYITKTEDKKDYAQTPNETQIRKKGDCEDRCIFAIALNYKYLNKEGKIYLVDTDGNGKGNHAMYSIDGKMYNKAKGSYRIIKTYSFNQIPYLASTKR